MRCARLAANSDCRKRLSGVIRFRGRVWRSAVRARSPARSWKFSELADEIYIEEIRRAGLYDEIWQAFAVILPVKTVGVMGDSAPMISSLACARSPRPTA